MRKIIPLALIAGISLNCLNVGAAEARGGVNGALIGVGIGLLAGAVAGKLFKPQRPPRPPKVKVYTQRPTRAPTGTRVTRVVTEPGADVAPALDRPPGKDIAPSGRAFEKLPVRPSGPDRLALLNLPPRPAPVLQLTAAPWLSRSADVAAPVDRLSQAVTLFRDKAEQLGLRNPEFAPERLRALAATLYDGSQLRSVANSGDGAFTPDLLQAVMIERAAARLPEFATALTTRELRPGAALDGLFAQASYAALQFVNDLNEATGLTNSVARFENAYGRLYPDASQRSANRMAPALKLAIANAMSIADSNFDRQGVGFRGKARVRRIVVDCLSDHLPNLPANVFNLGGGLDPSGIENAVIREASLACAVPAIAESSKPPGQLVPVPNNVVWSETGWKRDGQPWFAAASF